MATIKSFEEIKAWQEGRALAVLVYSVVRSGPLAKDFGLRDQIQRAAVSINSNIAEGFERDSNLEFVKFLGYAKGSAGELLSQVITAHDIGYLSDNDFEEINQKVRFIGLLISRLRNSIQVSDVDGLRWKPRSKPHTPKPRTPAPRNLETQKPRNLETQKLRNLET